MSLNGAENDDIFDSINFPESVDGDPLNYSSIETPPIDWFSYFPAPLPPLFSFFETPVYPISLPIVIKKENQDLSTSESSLSEENTCKVKHKEAKKRKSAASESEDSESSKHAKIQELQAEINIASKELDQAPSIKLFDTILKLYEQMLNAIKDQALLIKKNRPERNKLSALKIRKAKNKENIELRKQCFLLSQENTELKKSLADKDSIIVALQEEHDKLKRELAQQNLASPIVHFYASQTTKHTEPAIVASSTKKKKCALI